jgi:peroxiredoxin Q/BCP
LNPSFKKKGVVILGVSKDSIPTHDKFAEKYHLPYVLLSDPKTEMLKKYSAFGKKMMYGKEVQGTIRSTVIIDSKGEVVKHWPAVKNAHEHPAEVLAFLQSN